METKNISILSQIALFKRNLSQILKKKPITIDKRLQKTIDFYDLNAKQYVESTFEDGITQYQLTEFTNFIPKNSKILDIGTGSGRDAKYLSEEGHDITAIDLSKNILTEAKKRVKKVKFLQMDAMNLDLKDNTFDAIWCHATLYHLHKKQLPKALKEISRVLKQNGIFYLGLKQGTGEHMKKTFYTYYEMPEILKEVRNLNFDIIRAYSEKDWLNIFLKKH